FLRGAPALAHVFIAATLCATSVGITARVLRDLGRLQTREASVILGAAVIDDVMALLILAVVAGAIRAAAAGQSLALADFGLLAPVGSLLVPVFFVLMGLRVDLRAFGRAEAVGFALLLTAAAIAGKLACALGVKGRDVNRLAVGLGMMPRGEVSLIFVAVGATLALPGGQGAVVGAATFGAVVIMVAVTTLITPPALKWSLREKR